MSIYSYVDRRERERGREREKEEEKRREEKGSDKRLTDRYPSQYIRDIGRDNRQSTKPVPHITTNQVNNPSKQSTTTITTNLNKRKRNISLRELKTNSVVPKSTSSIYILQPLSKKRKQQMVTTTMPMMKENNNNILNQIYRFVSPIFIRSFYTISNSL